MRQLGTLPDAQSARRLCDYLQSLSVETRLDPSPEGCVVWVLDEDKLPQARRELEAFRQNPNDERFRPAAPPPPPQEPPRPAPRRRARAGGAWAAAPDRQLTISLIVTSVLVPLLYSSPPQQHLVNEYLFITPVFQGAPGKP